MWDAIALVAGILLLYFGAEWFVKGAAGLGHTLGVRPLVIGLTVVAYGTSMPELVVSMVAAVKGMSGIALGNVVGSNLANLGLILGITALIRRLAVEGTLIRRELPVMFGSTLLLPAVLIDGVVSRLEGILLLLLAVIFTVLTARSAAPAPGAAAAVEADVEAVGAPPAKGVSRLVAVGLAGLLLLVGGGQAFVSGASGLALRFGIDERVVGLTVASIGTSAPELAASIVAAVRGHASIAIGNVIGSNIFNVLFVLGGVAAVHPIQGALRAYEFDLIALVMVSAVALFLLRGARLMRRSEGAVLLVFYVVYLAMLVAL